MDVSESMVRFYLDNVTVSWFSSNDTPPNELSEYKPYIEDMKRSAFKHKDLETLRIVFEYLIANPNIDCERFNGPRYPFDSDEIREIICYSWRVLWPDRSTIPIRNLPNIKFIKMPLEEWWVRRTSPQKQNAD